MPKSMSALAPQLVEVEEAAIVAHNYLSDGHTWEQCKSAHPEICLLSHDGHEHREFYPDAPPISLHLWSACPDRKNCPLSESGHGPRVDDPPLQLRRVVVDALNVTVEE